MHEVAKLEFYRAKLSSTFRPRAVMLRNLCFSLAKSWRVFVPQGLEIQHAAKQMFFTKRNCPPHFVPKRPSCEPHAFYRASSRRAFVQRLKFYAGVHKVAKLVFYRARSSSTCRPRMAMLQNLCVLSSRVAACFCSKGCRHVECGKAYVFHHAKSCEVPKQLSLMQAITVLTR